MRVVAAGVHRARDLGRELEAGLLLERQAVHVAAQDQGRAGPRALDDGRHGAHRPPDPRGQAHAFQLVDDQRLRRGQGQADLGPPVEAPAHLEDLRQQGLGIAEQGGKRDRIGRHGRSMRGPGAGPPGHGAAAPVTGAAAAELRDRQWTTSVAVIPAWIWQTNVYVPGRRRRGHADRPGAERRGRREAPRGPGGGACEDPGVGDGCRIRDGADAVAGCELDLADRAGPAGEVGGALRRRVERLSPGCRFPSTRLRRAGPGPCGCRPGR